jgi:hypothetical protein
MITISVEKYALMMTGDILAIVFFIVVVVLGVFLLGELVEKSERRS